MMKLIKTIILTIAFGCFASLPAQMSNGGTFSVRNSTSWADIINESSGIIKGEVGKFLNIVNYGTVELDKCIMKGEVQSFGSLIATDTVFTQDLVVGGGETHLISCQLENLIITDKGYYDEKIEQPPQVLLTASCIINGSIQFKTDKGTVYKDNDVVIKGKVVNGKIISIKN